MLPKILIAVLFMMPSSWANVSARTDTSAVRAPVTVEADRWLTDATGAGMPVVRWDRNTLNRLAPQSLTSILPLIPGVFVQDYGGLGGLKTFSIRGGSASQALVLIDGVRMSSVQNATIDISMLPARFINQVSVVRGGVSALYGANALSGAMDIQLHVPTEPSIRTFASGGSFDEWRLAIGASASIGAVRIGADIESLGSAGSFPFTTNQFGERYSINRQNGDVLSHFRTLRIEADDLGSVTLFSRSTQRGVPGAIVQGAITNARARLADEDIVGLFSLPVFSNSLGVFSVVGSARFLDQSYNDPDARITGLNGIHANYFQRDATIGMLLRGTTSAFTHSTRIDGGFADLSGDAIVSDSGGLVIRRSVSASTDWNWEGAFDSNLDLRVAMRMDGLSDLNWAASPLFSVSYAVAPTVSMRTAWSYNFRPPSFNELYYLNYGTRSLLPERSHSINVGTVLRPLSWLMVDIDLFAILTRNLIVSVPINPVVTSAQNVGSAQSLGFELLARGSWFDGRLIGQWSYAYQQVTDQTERVGLHGTAIPYAVPEIASLLIQWEGAVWTGALQWSYTGYRFAQAGSQYPSLIQPYSLVGAQFGVHVQGKHSRVDVRLQADNIFDVSYEVVRGFPMPGRVVRVATSIDFMP